MVVRLMMGWIGFFAWGLISCGGVMAQNVNVIGGQTNVLLDTDLLALVGLELSGVSDDVIAPGNLGMSSVAFDINPRDDINPTTFSYTPGTLSPFAGTIEHMGSVFFNMDTVEVGDFSIGFDANRVVGDNSGFFVASTTGLSAILFDVANISELIADPAFLTVGGDLVVSSEFAGVLGDAALTNVDVGDALVQAQAQAIPEPSSMLIMLSAGFVLLGNRRRS